MTSMTTRLHIAVSIGHLTLTQRDFSTVTSLDTVRKQVHDYMATAENIENIPAEHHPGLSERIYQAVINSNDNLISLSSAA